MAIAGATLRQRRMPATRGILQAWRELFRQQPENKSPDVAAEVDRVFIALAHGPSYRDAGWAGKTLRRFTPQILAESLITAASDHRQAQQVLRVISAAGNWLGRNPNADYIVPRLLENSPWTPGHQQVWKNWLNANERMLSALMQHNNQEVASRAVQVAHKLGEIVAGNALEKALRSKSGTPALRQAIGRLPHSSWMKKFLQPGFDPALSRHNILVGMGRA